MIFNVQLLVSAVVLTGHDKWLSICAQKYKKINKIVQNIANVLLPFKRFLYGIKNVDNKN